MFVTNFVFQFGFLFADFEFNYYRQMSLNMKVLYATSLVNL
jgi:hypothetical protein